jgi:phosphoribosyl-ATP pyrophosphohydrolase
MSMNLEVYNKIALSFLEEGTTDEHLFVGFASEAGEVMKERMLEVRKGKNCTVPIVQELSDALWYITVIAHKRGYTLSELMTYNINKLSDRELNPK